jgi:ring-1,2-phenylacetyl-CoA epoxidase subunit PaaB
MPSKIMASPQQVLEKPVLEKPILEKPVLEPVLDRRWEVFKQDAPGKPHQAVGSIHAADPQHALVTARTVFVRRPNAISLWVAASSSILSVTLEELATFAFESEAHLEQQRFLVFRKTSNRRSMTFVEYAGALETQSPAQALRLALEQFADVPVLAWWIVPESAVNRTEDDHDTLESWFEPAKDKTYRQQSFYGTVGSHSSKHNPRSKDYHED